MLMIASDYDGTLHRYPDIVPEDRIALEKWKNAGNLFGIVTGRDYGSIKREAEKFNIYNDYFIVNNGAQVFDGKGNELYAASLDGKELLPIAEFVRDNGGLCFGVSHDAKNDVFYSARENKELDYDGLSKIKSLHQVNTYFATEEEARVFVEKANKHFYGIFNAYCNGSCVDIPPFGVSKSSGIAEALKIFGLDKEDVISVGDNYNDLDMIETYHGAAMLNGVDAVKAKASVIVKDFTELTEYFIKKRGV